MKIPQTKKIVKLGETREIKSEVKKDFPKTISFRPNEKSYHHFDKVKEGLSEKYGVDFGNTDTIEFALAFTFENLINSKEEEEPFDNIF